MELWFCDPGFYRIDFKSTGFHRVSGTATGPVQGPSNRRHHLFSEDFPAHPLPVQETRDKTNPGSTMVIVDYRNSAGHL